MPPKVLILTSFRQQVAAAVRQRVAAAAVRQRVVAVVVRQRVAAAVRQQVVAVARQQVVAAALEQAAVVVQRAFAGKILQTELCLPLQVAIASSFYLPPNEFCS
jgi:hypothetical protein